MTVCGVVTVCGTLTASDTVTVNGTVTMYDGRVTPYVIVGVVTVYMVH